MNGLQKTNSPSPAVRVDFDQKQFTDIINQKGRRVLLKKALMCPCKSSATNFQSNCKNCGGTGWIFVNPTETRMIVQGINLVNDFAPWSEENRGFANISYNACEELSYFDQLTLLDGEAFFSQVLFFQEAQDEAIFTYTTYPVREIKYIGLFKGIGEPLQKLVAGQDYSVHGNIITLNDNLIQNGNVENTNITVRYKHAPVFHLVEMKRETMQTFEFKDGGDVLKHLPLSAIARRAHYIPNIENLAGNRLLDNDYTDSNCNDSCCNDYQTFSSCMPAKKYPPINKTFTEETSSFTSPYLVGKTFLYFRNGQLDNQYAIDLLTGTLTPTIPWQENEFINIYVWAEAS